MTDEPCFNQLRTKEQLGYVVFSGFQFQDTWAGYRILIQSEKDCRYLEGRIENFLAAFEKQLEVMSDEDFEGHKKAIINKRIAKLKNLGQEDSRFWNHIYSDSYDFLQADEDAQAIDQLTKDSVVEFYAQHFSPSSSQRAKLSVHLQAQSKPKELTLDEKKTSAINALNVILSEHKLTPNLDALKSRIGDLSSTDALLDTVTSYITENLKLEKSTADQVLDEAKAALGLSDAAVSLDATDKEKAVPILIQDVHAWKAGVQVGAGAKPVRNLEDFVEVAEKL